MKLKSILAIILLMLLSLLGIFFLKCGDLIVLMKQEFIKELEESYQVRLSVRETSFWPLNHLVLQKVEMAAGEGELLLSAPEIRVYYDLFKVLTGHGSGLNSISYIELKEPVLTVNDPGFFSGIDGERDLFSQFAPLQLKVVDGYLNLPGAGKGTELGSLSLIFDMQSREDYSFSLNTAVRAGGLEYDRYSLERLNLNRFKLSVSASRGDWQASLDTGPFPLEGLSGGPGRFFSPRGAEPGESPAGASPVEVSALKGKAELSLGLSGRGVAVESYKGRLKLYNAGGLLAPGEYLQEYLPEELQDRLQGFFREHLQEVDFSGLNGELLFSSREEQVYLEGIEVTLAGIPLEIDGSLKYSKTGFNGCFARINSSRLDLAGGLLGEAAAELAGKEGEPLLSGKAEMALTMEWEPGEPVFNLSISLPEGKLNGQGIRDLQAKISCRSGLVYLDYARFKGVEEGSLWAAGIYNQRTAGYSLQLEGSNLKPPLFQEYLQKYLQDYPEQPGVWLTGRVNTSLTLNGRGFSGDGLAISGEVECTGLRLSGVELDGLKTGFWAADNLLLLENGSIRLGESVLDFSGELDLLTAGLDLQLAGKKIDMRLINRLAGERVPPVSGQADLSGRVGASLDSPLIELEISAGPGSLARYDFSALSALVSCQGNELSVSSLHLTGPIGRLTGSAYLEFDDIYPYLKAELQLRGCNYSTLGEIAGETLPLEGEFAAALRINGPPAGPEVEGELTSLKTGLLLQSRRYLLDKLKMGFHWQDGKGVTVKSLQAVMGQTTLDGKGLLSAGGLGFDFELQGLALKDTGLAGPKEVSGLLELRGRLEGTAEQPELIGEFALNELYYQEKGLGRLAGGFAYQGETLMLEKLEWPLLDNKYLISGEIENPLTEPGLELKIETARGELLDIIPYFPPLSPLPRDYLFKGLVEVRGSLSNPSARLDLTLFREGAGADRISLEGEIGRELNLEFEGRQLDISRFPFIAERGIKLKGAADFRGSLTGSLDSYRLVLETDLLEGRVSNFPVRRIRGEITVDETGQLYLQQQLYLPDIEGSCLEVRGSIPLTEGLDRLDLDVLVKDVPLALFSSAFSQLPRLEGEVAGQFTLGGPAADPHFEGQLKLSAAGIHAGLPEPLTEISGALELSGQAVGIGGLSGKYGGKEVKISGRISPFNGENIWDLVLSAEGLMLDYGSFNGRFDPFLLISGPLMSPLIRGEINIHDMVIGYPLELPAAPRGKGQFSPRVELFLYPGEDVYFRNDNIDVLIQEGSLKLLYSEGELAFKGQLNSEQGSFNYYNNKFILAGAEATFKEYQILPRLNIRAWTRVRGSRIEIRLQGPADNLITTFTSHPPLSREQILGLLTSRGGIGQFVFGNWGQIVQQEFFRIFAGYFQEDVVNNIRDSLREALKLDRLEIDTYDLGWNQEMAVYLGKYLGEKTYLQYSGILNQGKWENELALRYYLDENLIFEGSWQGEEDYGLSLKAEIEF